MKEKAVINQNAFKRYVWLHVGALAVAMLFPLYEWITSRLSLPFLRGCFLHDYLHVYCAFCGGTRLFVEQAP